MTPESDTPKCRVENQRFQKKFIQTHCNMRKYEKVFRRIGKFKKYASDMCSVISNHAVKVANLRDKNDEIAKCLDGFTRIEEFSTTSKLSMAVAAELVATVGDHQDLAVQRVETLVLPNLTSYARICDCIKADIWNAIQAIRREKRKKKCVHTLKKKSDDPKTKSCLSDAQRELERASAETARFCHLSEEQVMKFEHKRLIDLKESLGTFVKIQIAMYAKSLELLSETYKQIQSIDEDGDLEILKASLKIGSPSRKKSGSQLKENKSKKSVFSGQSQKSSCSNIKKNHSGGVAASSSSKKIVKSNDTSSSEEELSVDSSHSEVVRHLEKVLHSDHRNMKYRQQHHEKRQKCTSRASPPPLQAREASSEERKKGVKYHGKVCKDVEKGQGSTNRHRSNEKRNMSSGTKVGGRCSKTHQEESDNFSDEEYPPILHLGKRPSTPPRPLTVPISRRGSLEEDFSCDKKRNKALCHGQNNKRVVSKREISDSYYYSQSEEEKGRRLSSAPGQDQRRQSKNSSTGGGGVTKHVSFYHRNNDDDSNPHMKRTPATGSSLKVRSSCGGGGERCVDPGGIMKSNLMFYNNQRYALNKTENVNEKRQQQPLLKYC